MAIIRLTLSHLSLVSLQALLLQALLLGPVGRPNANPGSIPCQPVPMIRENFGSGPLFKGSLAPGESLYGA